MCAYARMVARFLVAICLFYKNFFSGANPTAGFCRWKLLGRSGAFRGSEKSIIFVIC